MQFTGNKKVVKYQTQIFKLFRHILLKFKTFLDVQGLSEE